MTIAGLTYHINSLITAPEIGTDLLWGLSLFFGGLALIYFVSVFFFRNKISSKSSQTKQRKTQLSPMISEFLFYEEKADKEEKSNYIQLKIEIRQLLKDDFNRKVLAEILLDLRKDVSGDTQQRLFKLYQDLGLEKDAFQKLKSWRWEVISKGILELTLMQVEDAYGFIVKFINDRRSTIRRQAEIATVTLKPGGIEHFLDTTKYKISEWQQLKLLDVLRNKENFEVPRFRAWLTSTNKDVVLFALRLIRYYNQNDANVSLIELIKHKNNQVRQQAIDCIREFHVVDALPTLKGIFWKCSVDIKITILGAIAELGNASDIEFLETVNRNEGSFSVKSKAVGAINTIAPESIMPTEGIEYVRDYDTSISENSREAPDKETPENALTPVESEASVTSDQNPNHNTIEKQTQMEPNNNSLTTLKNIEVIVEEVNPNSSDEELKRDSSEFDVSEISFLPIVVNNDKEPSSIKEAGTSEPVDEELEALITEIKELDFLPIVINDEVVVGIEPDHTFEELEHTIEGEKTEEIKESVSEVPEVIEGYSLSDFEVSFEQKEDAPVSEEENEGSEEDIPILEEGSLFSDENETVSEEEAVSEDEVNVDEKIEFNLKDEPIIDIENPDVEDVMSWLLAENELREMECRYEPVGYPSDAEIAKGFIPAPVYYDAHEAYMMGLLDDLEELGDHREIMLLEELRAEESKSFIKDRIASLIERFAQQRNMSKKENSLSDNVENLPVFSVFADLFKTIDTECKLILLDEIVAVGDEKEIEFLDGLLEDPDHAIRNKAQVVLKQLIAKLSHEKPLATYSEGVSAIVAEQIKSDEELGNQLYDGLLSEMDIESPTTGTKDNTDDTASQKTSEASKGSESSSRKTEDTSQEIDSISADNTQIFDIGFELGEMLEHTDNPSLYDLPVVATEVPPKGNGGSILGQLRNFTKLF